MDKNSITGLLIIGAILIGFSFYYSPSDDEIKQLQRVEDSIAASKKGITAAAVLKADTLQKVATDSVVKVQNEGPFASSAEKKIYTLENELVKISLSNVGGRVYSAELKNYKTSDGRPVVLFNGDDNSFGFKFIAGNKDINTNNLVFSTSGASAVVSGKDSTSLTFRLSYNENQYIDFIYSLKGNSYQLGFDVQMVGMQDVINIPGKNLDLNWTTSLLQTEKDLKKERENCTIYYNEAVSGVDYITPGSSNEEKPEEAIKWIGFKQHFFSSVLTPNVNFEQAQFTTTVDLSSTNIATLNANVGIPYKKAADQTFNMQFYFGPNKFNVLKGIGNDMERIIQLGWGPLKWINRWAVLPVFDFLGQFNWNYGIIILLLTLLLKLILSPLTYKSYISTAKMKILKPEMDEIKAKIGEDEPTKLQQEYLKLYKKAGVNPLGGCVPLLLQMPILFAFFQFFPNSIELRQESFLWVTDLSTYDSIWDFGKIPVIDFIYGDHVSLMCLLMTISTLIYTRLNNQISGATGQMKWMGYLMPIVFMGVLNSFSAGLNYYYFLANMITFGQQYLIRSFVDENAIHQQIQEHKKKPVTEKKSKFQQKLEEMAKARGVKAPKSKK